MVWSPATTNMANPIHTALALVETMLVGPSTGDARGPKNKIFRSLVLISDSSNGQALLQATQLCTVELCTPILGISRDCRVVEYSKMRYD
jgi:hypothetical protein